MLLDLENMTNQCEDHNPMKLKKVILWGHNDVLGDAVETFLATRNDWDVVRIGDDVSEDVFIEQVELEQPEVIIVYESDHASVGACLYQLLHSRPQIKAITLNLENNFLDVYDKHQVEVNSVSDLFSAIEE